MLIAVISQVVCTASSAEPAKTLRVVGEKNDSFGLWNVFSSVLLLDLPSGLSVPAHLAVCFFTSK